MPRTARARTTTTARRRAPENPAREAWAIVMQFFRATKQTFLAGTDLTMAQAQLLFQLDPDRPVPMSDVANTLGCDASNVTGLVDRLEERELIERRSDDADRRVKMVAVTSAGGRLRARLLERWSEAPAPIAGLPAHEIKALLRILRRAAGTSTA